MEKLATHSAHRTFASHWPLYVDEATELALFMLSACVFTVVLFHAGYPVPRLLPNAVLRRLLMGLAMGTTAVLIIHTPMGKRSGAHFNPAITLAYLLLGKIPPVDAMFYVVFQFLGGALGVAASRLLLGAQLADPSVRYAITVPGKGGTGAAFLAELFMAALLMAVVLATSNNPRLAPSTSYCVGVLIVGYIVVFAPVSGFSINPARTVASAIFAHTWTAVWIYFAAPLLGMLGVAEISARAFGIEQILCAKLHTDPSYPCPFLCTNPLHWRASEPTT